jgi:hypothetical protein
MAVSPAALTLHQQCVAHMHAGEDPRRALQVWRWLYYDGHWVASLQDTLGQQNGFAQRFIDKAQQLASVDGGLLLEQVASAKDGTTKLVFKLTEGEGAGGQGVRSSGGLQQGWRWTARAAAEVAGMGRQHHPAGVQAKRGKG